METSSKKLSLTSIGRSDSSKVRELQKVIEAAPKYFQRIHGHLPMATDAEETLSALPPGKGYEDKFVLGIVSGDEMVGCIDLIRGYPDQKTAMLGLLLLSEKAQGAGLGRQSYELVEALILNWKEIDTVRIGIVGTNDIVIPFWKKMGFVDTGLRRPYEHKALHSETLVLEKKVARGNAR